MYAHMYALYCTVVFAVLKGVLPVEIIHKKESLQNGMKSVCVCVCTCMYLQACTHACMRAFCTAHCALDLARDHAPYY